MLEKIKKAITKKYNLEEKKGLFFTGFSQDKKIVFSQGLLSTDENLAKSIDAMYEAYVQPNAKKVRYVVCDVVGDITEYTNTPDEFLKLSPEEYGFAAIDKEDDISGVILPNTSGVVDTKSALFDLKQKYGIHGQIELYAFRTERLIVAK